MGLWSCLAGHSTTNLAAPRTGFFGANWNNGGLGQQGFPGNANLDDNGGYARVDPTTASVLSFTSMPLLGGWAFGDYAGRALSLLAPAATHSTALWRASGTSQ